MAAVVFTYTRTTLPLEGRFMWTAAATYGGEALTGMGRDKGEARKHLTELIALARVTNLDTETVEYD